MVASIKAINPFEKQISDKVLKNTPFDANV
jgi:hypothetical protein